jgi:quercetin dioxygenase-like cupin family protein
MKIALPAILMSAIAFAATATLTTAAEQEHALLTPGQVEWSPGPASIPEGAEAAVLYGDPAADEMFVLRLKLPAGYHIPPHTHPKPEIVTVISGTVHLGTGEQADRESAQALEAGSFFAFEPGMAHYVFTDDETVLQLNSTGPWALDYVNPEDDPRS